MSDPDLKRTPLYDEHLRLGARMVPFAGWEMPVQYQSILQEHRAVRQAVGAFDVSHMGEYYVAGPRALEFLQWLTPNDVAALTPGTSQYSCLLRPNATIIDDVVIYRLDDRYLVVVNAGNVDKVGAWLRSQAWPDVTIENASAETALIAVQGPLAEEALRSAVAGDLSQLRRRAIRADRVVGCACLIARTGYTGEDGFEIFCRAEDVVEVWRAVLAVASPPVQPCGLGARDTLRLEAGNLLYGHDIDDTTNPLEAGLGFIVKFEKGDFLGRSELLRIKEQGLKRRLIGFEMVDRGIPRPGFTVLGEGRPIGQVTSGSYAPTLDRNIGLAYLEPAFASPGQAIDVVVRERPLAARVVKLPFYRSPRRAGPP